MINLDKIKFFVTSFGNSTLVTNNIAYYEFQLKYNLRDNEFNAIAYIIDHVAKNDCNITKKQAIKYLRIACSACKVNSNKLVQILCSKI